MYIFANTCSQIIFVIATGKKETTADDLRSIVAQMEYSYQIRLWTGKNVPFTTHLYVPKAHSITRPTSHEREGEGHVFKVHKSSSGLFSTISQSLGESHPVPAEALPAYEKVQPLRYLALRTRDGRLKCSSRNCPYLQYISGSWIRVLKTYCTASQGNQTTCIHNTNYMQLLHNVMSLTKVK